MKKIPLIPGLKVQMSRLGYVLDFLNEHPSFQAAGLCIVLAEEAASEGAIFYGGIPKVAKVERYIPADALFFASDCVSTSNFIAVPYQLDDLQLWAVAQTGNGGPFYKDGRFGFDVLETIFFHISRYEEWLAGAAQKDLHGRIKEDYQFLVRHQLQQQAVVDQLVWALVKVLLGEVPQLPTRYRMTHDIDDIIKFEAWWRIYRSTFGVIWRREDLRKVGKLWRSYLGIVLAGANDPYDTYDWMLKTEARFEKVLYLLIGGQTAFDTPYPLAHEQVDKIRRFCAERGYAIGLHPSYEAAQDAHQLATEQSELENWLGQPIHYSRQHYLRFHWPQTAVLLESAGISDDSSLGYSERIGFRCGTGFPYHLYNFDEERAYRFTETPMVFMDVSLLREGNYQEDQVSDLWHSFMAKNQYGTMITFNFHNSRFDDAWIHRVDLRKLYDQL